MKKIEKPIFTSSETIGLCIKSKDERVANADIVSRLNEVTQTVIDSETTYNEQALNRSLHLINSMNNVDGIVTKQEMVDLYDKTFVKSTKTRHIYEEIRSATEYGICPLCSQRKASTLDHYLPKSSNPVYTVTPINLLPSCPECNTAKSTHQAENANEQLFHPYFDEINDDRWLFGDVRETFPASVKFKPLPPIDWYETKKHKVINQFNVLELGRLYSSHAGVEISGMSYKLKKAFDGGGENAVKLRLTEDAESWFQHHTNCWQGVMGSIPKK